MKLKKGCEKKIIKAYVIFYSHYIINIVLKLIILLIFLYLLKYFYVHNNERYLFEPVNIFLQKSFSL